jgi:hypothetical protein
MLIRLRSRMGVPSPATVIALIALVVALGGVTYAAIPSGDGTVSGCYSTASGALRVVDAGKDEKCRSGERAIAWKTGEDVRSDDIADGQVRGADLAPGSVGRSKLAGNAVNGGKVADNSLTGADIAESTLVLGRIADAGRLDGKDSTAFGAPNHGFDFASAAPAKIEGAFVNVATSRSIPAGAYLVVARVEAVNAEGMAEPVECRIQTLPDGLLRDVAGHSHLSHYHLTLVASFATLKDGTVGVDCSGATGAEAVAKAAVVRLDVAG